MVGIAVAGIGLAGSVAGGIMSSDASSNAADAQVQAAQTGAAAQTQAAQTAQNTQLDMFNKAQANLQPFMQAGQSELPALEQGIASYIGQPIPTAPTPGQAPTIGSYNPGAPPPDITTFGKDFQKSPGYAFQMQEGIDAIQNSAAAKGGVVSGNTLSALDKFGQGIANQDFYNQYNAANQQYWSKYNAGDQEYWKNYDAQNQNYWNQYNAQSQQFWNQYNALNSRQNQGIGYLQNIVGAGQNAAANLGTSAITTGANIGNTQIAAGNAIQAGAVGAGNAIAAGTVGQANAWNNTLGQIGNIGSNYLQSQAYMNANNPSSYTGGLNAGSGAGAIPGMTGGY